MTRTFANTTALLSVITAALFGGCQKTMGTAANGPFSPAGSMAPATSQPLIPFGPLNGATRVPPPSTGSTQAGNSYASPAAYDSFASAAGQTVPGTMPFNNPNAAPPSLSENSRSNLGGMQVIDMTAGMNAPQNMQIPYANQAVGSGVAYNQPNNGWQSGVIQTGAYQPTQNISVPPSDLASRLRPLDANLSAAAIPMPGQSGSAPQFNNGYAQPPSAWQSVQPASAALMPQNPTYVSQLPTGPSTEPVKQSTDAASQSQANSLLWRNPAVAR